MSTPPSDNPRLPDPEHVAADKQPDLEQDNVGTPHSRIPDEEKDERVPDPEE